MLNRLEKDREWKWEIFEYWNLESDMIYRETDEISVFFIYKFQPLPINQDFFM